jgi:hypothetical protein
MNFKTIAVGLIVIAATSAVLVGLFTGFRYNNIDIQLHDMYYSIDPFTVWLVQTITLTLTSIAVLSISILKGQHLLIRLLLIAIMSAILVIPMMILYMRLMMP